MNRFLLRGDRVSIYQTGFPLIYQTGSPRIYQTGSPRIYQTISPRMYQTGSLRIYHTGYDLRGYTGSPRIYQTGCRPDMTFAVDWALSNNYLSTKLDLHGYTNFDLRGYTKLDIREVPSLIFTKEELIHLQCFSPYPGPTFVCICR